VREKVTMSEVPPTPQPSWDEIVRDNAARIYRLAYRLTGNVHDAEDLTQETFVRVFRSLDKFKPGSLEGWIHRITVNLFLDQARRASRYRFDAIGEEAERLSDPMAGAESQYELSHLENDVQAALASLPPEFCAAVVLCDIEGFSYEEIAAMMGVKAGTIGSRIHRGRAQLRAALAHRAPSAHAPAGRTTPTPRAAETAPSLPGGT
jgi:RNA polymerase sigma-70 factor (ECF subfamily)